MSAPQVELVEKLNVETGRIGWRELERHFARGVVIRVSPGLDLLTVAACIVEDDGAKVAHWLARGLVAHASTEEARDWQARQAVFWAVVTAPWVLVQEYGPAAEIKMEGTA